MKRIFMDFDGTLVNSRRSYCDVYSELYSKCEDYVHPNYKNGTEWNLANICPLTQEDLFSHYLFFNKLEFMNGAKQRVDSLSNVFDIIICTIGTYDNIRLKSEWIKYRLPSVKKTIFINNGANHMSKDIIDMRDSIIVDDVSNNLHGSNAEIKICFGEELAWNNDWEGIRCYNWSELYKELMKYKE